MIEDSWLKTPEVQGLSTLAFGAVVRLMCVLWYSERNEGLPTDDEQLQTLTRLDDEWGEIKSDVLQFFEERDGKLHMQMLDEQMARVEEASRIVAKPLEKDEKETGAMYNRNCSSCRPEKSPNDKNANRW